MVVREDRPGDQRLLRHRTTWCARPSTPRSRRRCSETLPDYMVPAAFVTLDALPLTPNGKIDRAGAARAGPPGQASAARAEPRDRHRAGCSPAIWAEVLGVPTLGLDDDFFDLGGHSLLATQVVAKLRGRTRPAGRVGVMDLFQHAHRPRAAPLFMTGDAEAAGPRRLLYELTKPIPAGRRVLSYVCVPYGGGSAIVYQPLADALPAGHALWSLAIPGHDVGLTEAAAVRRAGQPGGRRDRDRVERPARPLRPLRGGARDHRGRGPQAGGRRPGAGGRLHRARCSRSPARGRVAALAPRLERSAATGSYATGSSSMGVDTGRAGAGAGRPDRQRHAPPTTRAGGVLHRRCSTGRREAAARR